MFTHNLNLTVLIPLPSVIISLKVGKDNIIKIKDKSPVKKELTANFGKYFGVCEIFQIYF